MNLIAEFALRDGVEESMPRYEANEEHPFKLGWNAAINTLLRQQVAVMQWFEKLPPTQQNGLTELFQVERALFVHVHDEMNGNTVVIIALNLNDVFCPAADGEAVPEDQFQKLAHLHERYGADGLYAWAAFTRKLEDFTWRDRGARLRFQAALESLKDEAKKAGA